MGNLPYIARSSASILAGALGRGGTCLGEVPSRRSFLDVDNFSLSIYLWGVEEKLCGQCSS